MRIVNRKTFLALPAGTVYLQAETPFAWDSGLCIKGETCHTEWTGDWFYRSLTDMDSSGSIQLFERWDEMMADSNVSYPVDLETEGRDGLYQADAIFMIYEREDLEKLRDLFAGLASNA